MITSSIFFVLIYVDYFPITVCPDLFLSYRKHTVNIRTSHSYMNCPRNESVPFLRSSYKQSSSNFFLSLEITKKKIYMLTNSKKQKTFCWVFSCKKKLRLLKR